MGHWEKACENPLFRGAMMPASFCYGLGAYARLVTYSTGLASRRRAPAPVISVGNLTVGGTGKTPMTIELAERLSSAGMKVAVLSRGYGRRVKDQTVVADGTGSLLCDVNNAGDEPYLIAQAVPDAIVLVGASRLDAARRAVVDFGAQVLILDDGFQHIKLRRDIDIVLWDYNDDPSHSMLLPAGRFREPVSGLSRATDIIITKVPESVDEQRLARLVTELSTLAPKANIASCRFRPSYLSGFSFDGKPSQPIKLSELVGKKIFALSSIARPESFMQVLRELGVNPVGERHFPDHHWFSADDLAQVEQAFLASGSELLITTEKDMVRLKSLSQPVAMRTWSVVLSADWLSPMPDIIDRLTALT